MPAAEARKPRRTWRRSPPPWETTESSLSDSTGRTQGMTLRISPPMKARPMMIASWARSSGGVAPSAKRAITEVSNPRRPSVRVTVSGLPSITELAPLRPRTGTRITALRPSSSRATSGLP